ncbi:unnamed protein product [Ectocarpus sp. 8 AP-2014]
MVNPSALQILGISAVLIYVFVLRLGLHKVREGHVGVYYRGGALMRAVAEPGFHTQIPLLTSMAEIQVTVQTDAVKDIPCGTSGGVMVDFEKVEVVNRLRKTHVLDTIRNYTVNYDTTWIFDKIHHEINQFCSKHTLHEVYISLFDTLDEHLAAALQLDCDVWAPGIEIISVRVTKPRIPTQIRQNFEKMEAEKTKLLIAMETQRVVEKEAETERKKSTIEAQMLSDVSRINMDKELAEKDVRRRIASIEDEIHLGREKAYADAVYYAHMKEAESNDRLLTDNFLEYSRILSMGNTSKVYFGEKLPGVFVDSGPGNG